MAETPDPRRPNRSGPAAKPEQDVYGLAGDDETGHDDEPGAPPDASPFDDEASLAEGVEPPRPRGMSAPVAPLPRIWKASPEPMEVDTPPSQRGAARGGPPTEPVAKEKAKGKGKGKAAPPSKPRSKSEGGIERVGTVTRLSDKAAAGRPPKKGRDESSQKNGEGGEEGGVLVEETPRFDTQETRQAIRVIVGVVALGGVFLVGYLTFGYLTSEKPPVPEPQASESPVAPAPPAAAPSREQIDHEARTLFERARAVARKGDARLAASLLAKVIASYPNTRWARDAQEALGRPARNLPLFLDRPAVVATATTSDPQSSRAGAAGPPPAVVEATPAMAPQPTSGEVGLVLPANPAEPRVGAPVEDSSPPVGRPLPHGFRSRPGTQAHESGWALEIVGHRDGAPMVLVPGGTFTMGRDDGEPTERPAHPVKVSTFYIDQHEVSVRQFELFQKEANRRGDRDRALGDSRASVDASEDSPVVMVTAKDGKDYATWAGKRLPTEAQWEMAARGNDGRPYPWGSQTADWGGKREPRRIAPILSYANDLSPFGAYDMAGNAWEWTKDWYDAHYFQLFKKGAAIADPTGPVNRPRSQELVVKGGAKNGSATRREGLRWDKRLPYVGFRCVLPVEGPDNAFQPAAKATHEPAPTAPGGAAGGPPPF